jgi:MFS family permease
MTTTASPVAGVVERRALFDLLDRGVQGPVTLVCAPAGSGKTMLVRSWSWGSPSRALMGVGDAAIMPTTLSILTNMFPEHERPKAIAVWAAVARLGVAVSPSAAPAATARARRSRRRSPLRAR